MSRYFFNIDDGQVWPDPVGVDLGGPQECRREAMRLFEALLERDDHHLSRCEHWRLDVTDLHGRVVLSLELSVQSLESRAPSVVI